MSEGTLNDAILRWMAEHSISRGDQCPVLKVSLVGYDAQGRPLFTVRAAYDRELRGATNGEKN